MVSEGEPENRNSGYRRGARRTTSEQRAERNEFGRARKAERAPKANPGRPSEATGIRRHPPPMPDKLDEQWKSRLAAAAQAARQAGKLSQSLMRFVDDLLAPQLPWRALLARYMMNAARDDYSFQRPSRREGEALMPRLYSQGVNVVVALDTSGSSHTGGTPGVS
jgi:hypothetical protein